MSRRYTDELTERDRFFFWEPPQEGEIDMHEPFGNGRPLHIEIGSGRGEFIAERARRLPQVNFVGFEGKGKRLPAIMAKLNPAVHANVRITRLYLNEDTVERMPPGSVQMVYILHPDPWPKQRHHKRRLIRRSFLDLLARLLVAEGEVRVSTDHAGYAEWIVHEFAAHPAFAPLPVELDPEEHIVTHFEAKKRAEGYEPFHMRYRRKTAQEETA